MVDEIQYTSIKRVLDNIMDHPLLRDVTMEQAIRYTLRFIGLHGYTHLYQDKIENIDIHDFRGLLPCDLISINQVKDCATGICLRAMTDTFPHALREHPHHDKKPMPDNMGEIYIPKGHRYKEESAFKTQGRVIFTSFPEGRISISYKAIPVDNDGFPLLIDNEVYLAALEAFIKVQVFTIKFDTGKISGGVLQNAQQEYAWRAGQLDEEMKIPSISEMETLTRMYNTLLLGKREFDNGFRDAGNREYLRRH